MELSQSGYHFTITLQENCKMSECINFRTLYERVPSNASLTLDFKSVTDIDSSCIIMLMSLYQHFEDSEQIRIVNCNDRISDIFAHTYISSWLH